MEKAKGPGYFDLYNRSDDIVYQLTTDFKNGLPLTWPVVSKNRLHQVWNDFITLGYVKDIEKFDKIFNTIRDAVIRLEIATICAEHTGIDPNSILSEHLDESQYEAFTEWLVDFGGANRLSDYGLEPLKDAVALCFEANNYAEKIKYLDRALHVVHCRGDLSLLFVEGGRASVIEIEYDDNTDFKM